MDILTKCGIRILAAPQSVINGFGQMPVPRIVEAAVLLARGGLRSQTETAKQAHSYVPAAIALDHRLGFRAGVKKFNA